MADKSRSIQTKFWYDTWIEELNTSEKLLYLYFLTNPLTNLLGVYEISIKRISDESGISKETVQKALKRFESDSRIIYTDNFIIITKFLKNQKLNPNMQLNVESLFEALPNFLKDKILDNGSKGFESIRNGLLKLKGKLKEKVKEESESESAKKHKRGKYKNVLLTDQEFEKLKTKFGNWEELIKKLDEGIEMKGYKYKSHYLAIVNVWSKNQPKSQTHPNRGVRRQTVNLSEEEKEQYR